MIRSPTEAERFGSSRTASRQGVVHLLSGQGRFTDDISVPGQVFGHFVRAQIAHGNIRRLELDRALQGAGVIAIITGEELKAAGLGTIGPAPMFKNRDGSPMFITPRPILAHTTVRFSGEAIALVVAETLAAAADAAELVNIDYDEFRAVSNVGDAMQPQAPRIWQDAKSNIALDWESGDRDAVERAFLRAAHIERVRLVDTRVAPSALEPRAAIADFNPTTQCFQLIAPTQGVSATSQMLARAVFRVDPEKIQVLTYDVGGGFGMKGQVYPEYAALMFAARKLGRPIKWCATRLESFLSDTHGRDGLLVGELALDADGRILALRAETNVGVGAYETPVIPIIATLNTKNCLSSVYDIPAIHFVNRMVLTNAAPLGPYRGAGRPEAIYIIERLLDSAAESIGIDRVEIRRRNYIPTSAMPYMTAVDQIYDSGEFENVLDQALEASKWATFSDRRAEALSRGKLRGIGLASFLEIAGGMLEETVDLRFDKEGTVTLRTGAQAMGQGHHATLVPLIATRLGIDVSRVRLLQGDSRDVPPGPPTVASRSAMMVGGAIAIACDAAVEKGRQLAAQIFQATADTITFANGDFAIGGTGRRIPLLEVAELARDQTVFTSQTSLDTMGKFTSPHMTFPNGCHVCEVEVDPDTGAVDVVGYVAVDDVGNMLNESIVEGQIRGGVAQGLGQVLGEHVVYGETGQLLTASFMDYRMLRADDLPPIQVIHHSVPCKTNPLGVKGAGESGVAGSLPAGVNAILDALSRAGIKHLDLPFTASRIWSALHQEKSQATANDPDR